MNNIMVQSLIKEWLVLLTTFGVLIYALSMIAAALRRKQQNLMQRHVLDKFASAKDFADFVQSPAGQRYVMSFADTATNSQNAILNSVRTGVVLLFMGLGFALTNFAVTWILSLAIGVVLGCLGVGFLVSAAISYWLAKKFQPEAKE
jgi:hypothetical protein